MRPQSNQRGFSLVELMLVVTIIGILAAITTLYIVQAQQAARSASAISSLRVIHSSECSYRTLSGNYGDMAALQNNGYIGDPSLAAGQKSKYTFVVTPGTDPTQSYTSTADPLENPALWKHFYIDESGIMRVKIGGAATATSSPL